MAWHSWRSGNRLMWRATCGWLRMASSLVVHQVTHSPFALGDHVVSCLLGTAGAGVGQLFPDVHLSVFARSVPN